MAVRRRTFPLRLLAVLAPWAAVSLGSIDADAQDRAACLASYDRGQAARDERKLILARREFTVCASEACPQVLRKDCIAWIRELEDATPTVVLRAIHANGRDASRVAVELDGEPLVPMLDGKAIPVDPGPHTFRFHPAGAPPIEERVVVAEGDRNRSVVVRLASEPAKESPREQQQPTPATSGSPLPAVVAASVGVLALAGATYFYATGFSDGEDLRDACGSPPTCKQDDVDAAHAKLLVGDVLLGSGLVALGVATYLYLTRDRHDAPAAPKSSVTAQGLRLRF